MGDEHFDVVVDGVDHQLPVDDVEDTAFRGDDQVGIVPSVDHIVQSICSWVFDLEVLGRNEEADEGDQQGVIVHSPHPPHLGRVDVHQVDSVVDGLVVTLKAFSDIAQVVNSLDTFL